MKKLFIITGASRGLGESLSQIALQDEHFVIGLSRSNKNKKEQYYHLKIDLSKPKNIHDKIFKIIKSKNLQKIDEVILINNAAMITPINYIDHFSTIEKEVNAHFDLNLISPILLTSAILNIFSLVKTKITIVNISSGAALHPIENWSLYCSAKAGLKMFTENLQLEYGTQKNFRVFDISPGVMDTEMQATIRNQSNASFVKKDRFIKLKEEGKLLSPNQVALILYKIVNNHKDRKRIHYDVNEFKQ